MDALYNQNHPNNRIVYQKEGKIRSRDVFKNQSQKHVDTTLDDMKCKVIIGMKIRGCLDQIRLHHADTTRIAYFRKGHQSLHRYFKRLKQNKVHDRSIRYAKYKTVIININSLKRIRLFESQTDWEQIIDMPPPPPLQMTQEVTNHPQIITTIFTTEGKFL